MLEQNFKFKNETLLCRNLDKNDIDKLYNFLTNLSTDTIQRSFLNCDLKERSESFCNDIGLYDKHRYVLFNQEKDIIALFEFSLDFPPSDIVRYNNYENIPNIKSICRWGLTIADKYQNKGIGTITFPLMKKIAKELNKSYIILYGGVYESNKRAIHYYKKVGFIELGYFVDTNNINAIDMILKI